MIQILKNTHKIIVISKNHEFFAKVNKKFMAKYHKFIGGAQLNYYWCVNNADICFWLCPVTSRIFKFKSLYTFQFE